MTPYETSLENVRFYETDVSIFNVNSAEEFLDKVKRLPNSLHYFLDIIKKIIEAKGQPVKSSFKHELCIKINNEMYMLNRNICNQEGQALFDEFKLKLYEILDINE